MKSRLIKSIYSHISAEEMKFEMIVGSSYLINITGAQDLCPRNVYQKNIGSNQMTIYQEENVVIGGALRTHYRLLTK